MKKRISGRLLTQIYASVIGLSCLGAYAAPIEETIVTVQKREESLQDLGLSVAAYSGETLDKLGVISSDDIDEFVPGVEIGPNQLGNRSIAIRGIGVNEASDFDNVPNSAAVHFDEIYQSSPVMNSFLTFDLERVEIVKGPQGTLYGRNATSGAINYISRKPAEEFGGQVSVDFARYDRLLGKFAVDVPVSDTLRTRLAAAMEKGGGNYRVKNPEEVPGLENSKLNEADRGGVRLVTEWDASDTLAVTAILQKDWDNGENVPGTMVGEFEIDDSLPSDYCENQYSPDPTECTTEFGIVDTDGDPFLVGTNVQPDVDRDMLSAVVRLDLDTAFGTLTSVTGWQNFEQSIGADRDGTEFLRIQEFRSSDIDQWSTELRLQGYALDFWDWLIGAYYSEVEMDINRGFENNTSNNIHFNSFADETSKALFLHNEFGLSDTWSLIAGVRYTEEDKSLWAESALVPQDLGIPFTDVAGLGDEGARYIWLPDGGAKRSASWDDTSGTVGLEWRPTDDILLYANWSRGFKSGGFSGSFTIRTSPPSSEDQFRPYNPEISTQHEIGFKSTLLDGSMQLNLAAYQLELEDRVEQVLVTDPSAPNGVSTQFFNAASANIDGFEAELIWYPSDRIDLRASGAWMDAKYEDFELDPRDPSQSRDGFRMAQAPEFSGVVMAGYTLPLDGEGSLRISVDGHYTGDQYFNSRNVNSVGEDSYTLWNSRVSWTSMDGMREVAAYVRNLTDEEYIAFGVDALSSGNQHYYGRQRHWGVELLQRF